MCLTCPPGAGEKAAQVAAISGQEPEYKPAKCWQPACQVWALKIELILGS